MHRFSFSRKSTVFAIITLAICSFVSCGETPKSKPSAPTGNDAKPTMAAIMADVRQKMNTPQNGFSAEAKLASYESQLASVQDPAQRASISFSKAIALLEYGDETAAVALYEELMKIAVNNAPEVRKRVMSDLALAYLRLGERNNCVNMHSTDACVMPIQGGGIHRDKTGSRKAAELYETLLKEDPSNLDARWLLNIAYMTLGEYPTKVPRAWLIPGLDAPSAYPAKPFIDVANELKIATNNRSGGSIVDDFDNDGYLDIVISAWGLDDPMHYFHNNGDGTFSDLSKASGLQSITGGLNMTHADYNNDGHLDILVLRGAWQGIIGFGEQPNSLLRNNGDGTFTDVTIEAGMLSYHPTQTATWNDFNNDGWVDVFIGNETTSNVQHFCELYINNQNGTFTNVSGPDKLNILGFVKGVTSGDYDNDGWPDLFLSTMNGTKLLLRNMGVRGPMPVFENATQKAGFAQEISKTFPTWFWDYDNDGWLDIFVSNYDFDKPLSHYAAKESLKPSGDMTGKPYIYRNNGNGTFSNVTSKMNINYPAFAMSANFGDIDNDGYLDMYLGTGNPNYESLIPNKMYRNMGGKKFVDVTTAARVGNLQKGHGISFADIDNDGDQDIHLDMGGAYRGDAYPNALYLNPGQNTNNWIVLKLEGTTSNRAAIGAKVKLTFSENGKKRTVYREVNSGGSFGCSPFRREIGLGKANTIDEIIIAWPASGTTQTFKNVNANQFIKIKEGQDNYEKVALKTLPMHKINSVPMCAPVQ